MAADAGPVGSPAQLPNERGNRGLKALDRLLGIPVLGALGAARRLRGRRALPPTWRRVGLIKTAAIGDVILLSGVVEDLRASRPDAHIVLFATATNAAFARLLDGPDEVVVLPVRDVRGAVRRIRAAHLDVCVDLGSWPRFDALLTALSGARFTIGRSTRGQHRHFAYDVSVPHSSSVHEVDNFRALVRPLGIESTSEPRIHPPGPPMTLDQPYAVLHLWPGGANFRERCWPPDRWQALARVLDGRGLRLVLTGGPGDASVTDATVAAWCAAGLTAQSAAGVSADECARWLAGAAGVVSVNTGVMHLAAAVGTPTIGLNGPTSCRRWGPVGPRSRCVPSPVVPDGYLDLGFERDDRYPGCMDAITVDAVLQVWDELVGCHQA